MDIFARIMAKDFANYSKMIGTTDLSTKNSNGASLLQVAVAYGSEEIALDLVARGIEIDQETPGRNTELQDAFALGLTTLASELVNRGANLSHRNNYGNNALWYAATHPRPDYDLVKLLVEKGSDVTTRNEAGRSPLDAARERGNKKLVEILEAGEKRANTDR